MEAGARGAAAERLAREDHAGRRGGAGPRGGPAALGHRLPVNQAQHGALAERGLENGQREARAAAVSAEI